MIPCFAYMNDFHLFPVAVNHFSGGQHPVRQWHEHFFSELVFILGGEAVHVCNDRRSPVSAGDVLLIHPGAVHAYEHDMKSLELFNVLYDGSRIIMPRLDLHRYLLFKKFFPEMPQAERELSTAEPILHLAGDDLAKVKSILDNMAQEADSPYTGHVFAMMTCFMQLLLALCRYLAELVDEDGNAVRFEHLMTLEHEGKPYICLVPLDPMEDVSEDELVILRIDTDSEGNDVYATVEDEAELDAVFEKYLEIAEADEGE